jgi:feruloyl esterase
MPAPFLRLALLLPVVSLLAACSTSGPLLSSADPQAACTRLAAPIAAARIGLPSGDATIDSASLIAPGELAVAERGPTPAATITPAAPQHCQVVGRIAPLDPKARRSRSR